VEFECPTAILERAPEVDLCPPHNAVTLLSVLEQRSIRKREVNRRAKEGIYLGFQCPRDATGTDSGANDILPTLLPARYG
jgi:hypothetical protein